MILPTLTILNTYDLTSGAAAFETAIAALVGRVEHEGHSGVISYRFFVNEDEQTARAVIDYTGPDAWIGHHDIAMAWPEMKSLHSVARLSHVTFLGTLTPQIKEWIDGSTLTATLHFGNRPVAGFQR